MELEQVNKGYNSGHSIVYSCQYHVVWCPKYRRKVLDEPIAERLKALILEQQDEYQYKILDMEVMPDHVHIVIDVDPRVGVVKVVGKIKGTRRIVSEMSSLHLKADFLRCGREVSSFPLLGLSHWKL